MKKFLPEYLEMCEKAEQLQSDWIPEEGHYCIEKEKWNEELLFPITALTDEERKEYKKKYIWIPTGIQLKKHLHKNGYFKKLYNDFISDFSGNENLPDDVKKDENIRDLMALMEIVYFKEWDFDNKEWIQK